jgi:hypothetical protein
LDSNRANKYRKRALVIGTISATSELLNGGALRVRQIIELLEDLDFQVQLISKNHAKDFLHRNEGWALIVISSYSCAALGKIARSKTDFLWFDPYDSWTKSRLSLIMSGSIIHIPLLLRDKFYTARFPETELVTFLTQVDSSGESRFCRNRLIRIFPIMPLLPLVKNTTTTRIVFVGDGSYRPNRRCLKFLNQLGKELGTKISVIGKGYSAKKSFKNIEWLGYRGDSELYWERDVHIAPVTLGAGIKTKVAAPLMLGLPVIVFPNLTTPFKALPNLWVANTPKEFASILRTQMPQKAPLEMNFDIYKLNESNEVKTLLKNI